MQHLQQHVQQQQQEALMQAGREGRPSQYGLVSLHACKLCRKMHGQLCMGDCILYAWYYHQALCAVKSSAFSVFACGC